MTDIDILTYLSQFDKFSAAKIQRCFKWGYNRAINKIIELVDSGLIYEIPDEPLAFKISKNGQNPSPLNESFSITLKNREPIILKVHSHKVRIWFEPIPNNNVHLIHEKDVVKSIRELTNRNTSNNILIANASNHTRTSLKNNTNINSNINFSCRYLTKSKASIVIIIINSRSEIKTIKRAIQKSIEKIYIIGCDKLLTQCKKSLAKQVRIKYTTGEHLNHQQSKISDLGASHQSTEMARELLT